MEKLKAFLKTNNLPHDEDVLKKFHRYRELVFEWNEKVNITAIKDPLIFEENHLIDSLSIACFPEFAESERVLDVGTGAGLPGIPLSLVAPDKQFLLLDSVGKKLKIVDLMTEQLGLKNVKVLHARAEDAAHEVIYREVFDLVVSRALAKMSVLSEYCIPYVKVGGWFVAYKTKSAAEEIKQAANAIEVLGGKIREMISPQTEDSDHVLVWIEKVKNTPSAYPRKAGFPSKEPL